MSSFYLKALHLIFMVTWFAGLFYIVRLFVYQTEAMGKEEPERSILLKQFRLMQKRLWYGITWPGMILTVVFGLWLSTPFFQSGLPPWLLVKLLLVGGLVLYHFYCHYVFVALGANKPILSGFGLRILNEVATLFLFAIIFTAVVLRVDFSISTLLGMIGVLAVILTVGILVYRKRRNRQS